MIEGHGLLVGACQHHLWAATLALRRGVRVERLGGEALALEEDIAVEIGQHGGVEPDVVLDEQYHLHTGLLDVVLDVHLVLEQLDDGEDEVGVAEPAEDVVEDRHVLVLDAAGDAMRERREHHTRQVGEVGLDVACHGERVVIGIAGHADHQVDIGVGEHVACLLGGAHLGKRRWVAHTQLHILVEDFLVYTSIVLEHERVVGVGHDEHVEDAVGHEVDERHVFQIELRPLLWYVIFHIYAILTAKLTFFRMKTK